MYTGKRDAPDVQLNRRLIGIKVFNKTHFFKLITVFEENKVSVIVKIGNLVISGYFIYGVKTSNFCVVENLAGYPVSGF
jgi:hypothetical protein